MGTFKANFKQKKFQKQRDVLHKQPVFRQIFWRYLCLFAVIALVIGFVGTRIAIYCYNQMQASEFNSVCSNAKNRVSETYTSIYGTEIQEEMDSEEMNIPIEQEGGITPLEVLQTDTDISKLERWKRLLHFYFATQSSDFAIALYDVETRELYADSSVMVFMLMKDDENETGMIYESSAELWKEAFAVYEQQNKGRKEEENFVTFEVEDIYVQNYTFVPGKVQIVERDGNTNEIINVLEEYDMTPENAESYRHIELSEGVWHIQVGPGMVGLEPGEPVLKGMEEWMEQEEDNIWSDNTDFEWEEAGTDGSMTIIKLSDNLKVRLIIFGMYNIFEEYGKQIGFIYAGIFFLTVLLAWILSYRSFQIANARYQMDQYRRDTTNAMAHDLKTPLMAISGYAENLQNNVHPEKHNHYITAILNNVKYMNEMIGKILELSKVEGSRGKLEKAEVDLASITEELLKKYEVLIEERGLHVQVEGNMVAQADSIWINQALDNLLGNAIKYADAGTAVKVCISEYFYEVRNVVKDNLGQSAEKLVEPFVKGDNSRSGNQGTGIGLAIVKQIAELHGYTLQLMKEDELFVARLVF